MVQFAGGWILDDIVLPGAKLTQGDLIRFEDEKDPLKKVGIVATADCDLANQKHARLITLIPVVSTIVIMEYYLLPEYCEKKRIQIENFAFTQFSIEDKYSSEVKRAILSEKLEANECGNPTPPFIAAYFLLDRLEKVSISHYKILMSAIRGGHKKPSDITQQIKNRGDLLVLPELDQFGIDANIAWVRHIWQVHMSEIAIKTSEISSRRGERLARLESPFRYRLTQRFAQVFSDIGLPDISDNIQVSVERAYKHV